MKDDKKPQERLKKDINLEQSIPYSNPLSRLVSPNSVIENHDALGNEFMKKTFRYGFTEYIKSALDPEDKDRYEKVITPFRRRNKYMGMACIGLNFIPYGIKKMGYKYYNLPLALRCVIRLATLTPFIWYNYFSTDCNNVNALCMKVYDKYSKKNPEEIERRFSTAQKAQIKEVGKEMKKL